MTIVVILGDSMMKGIKGFEISSKDQKVVVKSFSGATVDCMKDYVKPTISTQPGLVVLHCGTKNLRKPVKAKTIASNILDLAIVVSEKSSFIISGIIPRGDNLYAKAIQVNQLLNGMCAERNIRFIDHSNIDPKAHLNRSKFHQTLKAIKLYSTT